MAAGWKTGNVGSRSGVTPGITGGAWSAAGSPPGSAVTLALLPIPRRAAIGSPLPTSARWWEPVDDGARFRCGLCPRACTLSPGQRGFCHVRQATPEGIALTTWGRCTGLAVDPIEKKPLYHFLPGSRVLSFGTLGCNLGCRFCQNWTLSRGREDGRRLVEAPPEAVAAAASAEGCASVAFTYNEPLVFAEYALDCAAACHAAGRRTVAVTAGYVLEPARAAFFAGMDAANVDLKAFDDGFYRRLCGARLGPVLDTLRFLARETRVHLEVTTLLIPGENDGDADLHALCGFVAEDLGPGVPLHFSAFHPAHEVQDRPRTPLSTLRRARAIGLEHGLLHVYLGNVLDPGAGDTHCPGCGALLVERAGYSTAIRDLAFGACARCGRALRGVFEG
jgi:pyruvate formate lyase activating enzyme